MEILSRQVWNARPPERRYAISTPTPELWLHHTAGSQDYGGNGWFKDDLRSIQDYHMDTKGWSDIAYSLLTDHLGQAWEGRGIGIAGGHTYGRNTVSHAICAIGNYEVHRPRPEMLETIAWLVAHGLLAQWWKTGITGPHRDAPGAQTACCGKYLIAEIPAINRRAGEIISGLANPSTQGPLIEEDDMAEMIKTLYNLARRKTEGDFYDVLARDPEGYYHWQSRCARHSDPLGVINNELRPALERETGRKLPVV